MALSPKLIGPEISVVGRSPIQAHHAAAVAAPLVDNKKRESDSASRAVVGLVPGPKAAHGRRSRSLRSALLAGTAALALAAAGHCGWDYWTTGRFEVTTNNAYVKADNTTIAPKVSGYLSAVLVGDNDLVQAGQVLTRIDDRDFRVALLQAAADVAHALAEIQNSLPAPAVSKKPAIELLSRKPLRIALAAAAAIVCAAIIITIRSPSRQLALAARGSGISSK